MKRARTAQRPRPLQKNDAFERAAIAFGLALSSLLVGTALRRAQAEPLASSAPTLMRIDGIAAIVGGAEAGEVPRTILRSDVELRARLSLLGHDVAHALLGELPASLLAATLDELLGEQLIATEAERVQIAKPSPNEIARERREIEREAGGHRAVVQLLGRLDASGSELDVMAARRALISAFLRANLEGATIVTENEIDARLRE
ncbi:MAG TPA: hypothetical protein VGI70_10790, partial [Polyangiales bacterium]